MNQLSEYRNSLNDVLKRKNQEIRNKTKVCNDKYASLQQHCEQRFNNWKSFYKQFQLVGTLSTQLDELESQLRQVCENFAELEKVYETQRQEAHEATLVAHEKVMKKSLEQYKVNQDKSIVTAEKEFDKKIEELQKQSVQMRGQVFDIAVVNVDKLPVYKTSELRVSTGSLSAGQVVQILHKEKRFAKLRYPVLGWVVFHERKGDNLKMVDSVEEAQDLIAAHHKEELRIKEDKWNQNREKRKEAELERRKKIAELEKKREEASRPAKEVEQLKRQVENLKKQNQGLKSQVNTSLLRRRRERHTVVVSDAGIESINGTYVYSRLFNSKPLFRNKNGAILYFREFWKLNDIEEFTGWLYYNPNDVEKPPEDPWTCAQRSADFEPAPTIVNSV